MKISSFEVKFSDVHILGLGLLMWEGREEGRERKGGKLREGGREGETERGKEERRKGGREGGREEGGQVNFN